MGITNAKNVSGGGSVTPTLEYVGHNNVGTGTVSKLLTAGTYILAINLMASTSGNLAAWVGCTVFTNVGTLLQSNTDGNCGVINYRTYALTITEDTTVSVTSYAVITMAVVKIA